MTFQAFTMGLILFLRAVPAIATNDVDAGPTFLPKKIVSGSRHTCLISKTGQLKCWGFNNEGQLGVGSTLNIGGLLDTMGPSLPIVDLGNDVVVKDMCVGSGFSCALATTGGVKCWGVNNSGQLGQEATRTIGGSASDMGDKLPWTNLGTNFVATEVHCGTASACALNTKGQVKCWGRNGEVELGRKVEGRTNLGDKQGDMGDKLPYLPLPTVSKVVIGTYHACASSSQNIYCWGINDFGHSGTESTAGSIELPADGTNDTLKVKLEDAGVSTTIYNLFSGDEHICAQYTAGMETQRKIKCWGSNSSGQLGIGSAADNIGRKEGTMGSKLLDLQVDSSDFIQIEAYATFSCALKKNGVVQCWGGNSSGQLGLGDTVSRGKKPTDLGKNLPDVNLSLPVLALSHGPMSPSVCALFINHEIKCWGAGADGQLGYEDKQSRGGQEGEMGDNLPFVRYK